MKPIDAQRIPLPVLVIFRGVGQVFFQESALSGACFALAIALSSPLMAIAAVVGSAVGAGLAWTLKYDKGEIAAGIHGFNPALVGIATFFFFSFGAGSIAFAAVGCCVATVVTWAMRKYVPFPTYTTPFILTTWVLFFLGKGMGMAAPAAGGPTPDLGFLGAVANGIGQVMFQGTPWAGLIFLAGLVVSEWRHAAWIVVGSIVGVLVGSYHGADGLKTLDPERLVERTLSENVALGLYGYNATLAAVALYLNRPSFVAPLLGSLLAVFLTEVVPKLGVPALTAPFVLATWLVLGLGLLERRLFEPSNRTPA